MSTGGGGPPIEKINMAKEKIKELNAIVGMNFEIDTSTIFKPAPAQVLKICCVFPELQPRSDQIKSIYNFVGCCIADQVRSGPITHEKLKLFLDAFEPLNPNFQNLQTVSPKKARLRFAGHFVQFLN
jgi:hypothetical protein